MNARFPWLWDTDMDNAAFEGLLRGETSEPYHDFRWALLRLIEYAPYREIRRLLPRERFLEEWPQLAPRVRSRTRREGMEFMHQWFRQHQMTHG
jgi:hypothetical protein